MAEREQIARTIREDTPEVAQEPDTTAATKRGEEMKAELDDLLEEIDEVLEVNAKDFVNSYIQKGGQ